MTTLTVRASIAVLGADANGDQRLSWSEYYDMRFIQTRSCAAAE
jgi:hypothetical protein